ncbi:hypothetical protein D5018_20875 [Parashewanella curva]|uniref:Uncharacterized protein n=1 Tax=Parashewanella curva TaxID=2338552 RepID=A0A3L8PUN4_9GAMM|nr:hypothetical protein D5018_20875 [Parashewanella curva]
MPKCHNCTCRIVGKIGSKTTFLCVSIFLSSLLSFDLKFETQVYIDFPHFQSRQQQNTFKSKSCKLISANDTADELCFWRVAKTDRNRKISKNTVWLMDSEEILSKYNLEH